jgi:hypothetical protein
VPASPLTNAKTGGARLLRMASGVAVAFHVARADRNTRRALRLDGVEPGTLPGYTRFRRPPPSHGSAMSGCPSYSCSARC